MATDTSAPAYERVGTARRWWMLVVSTTAQASSAAMVHGPAFLIPALHSERSGLGLSLAGAGAVAAASMAGLMCTLVLWGAAVDRYGERRAMLAGLAGVVVAGAVASLTGSVSGMAVALFVAGASSGATNAASGRVVVGWFPPERRGLAMGIRQCAQPLGVGLGALTMATIAAHTHAQAAIWVPTGLAALALVLVAALLIDPPRPRPGGAKPAAANPYRADRYLARVHATSAVLVIPQFVVWTYGLTWLVEDLGWAAGAAGVVVAGTQLIGAAGRIGAGQLSDSVASRLRPMRWIAWAACATMLLLGLTAQLSGPTAVILAVALLVVASAVTVADNGLAYAAVAERAGASWSGRALGIQNTTQYLVAAAVPPVTGALITATSYGAAFAIAGLVPLAAVALVPVRDEHAIS